MKIYKISIKKLSSDWGYFEGWEEIGYYLSKEKAEQVAQERYEKRNRVIRGETKIETIEVEE